MNYRQFGRTKLQISEVSLGGAYLMGPHPAQAEDNARQVVKSALALGINYIDTAPLYGMSERLLGQALEGIADQFLLPKWGWNQKILITVLTVFCGVWIAV